VNYVEMFSALRAPLDDRKLGMPKMENARTLYHFELRLPT